MMFHEYLLNYFFIHCTPMSRRINIGLINIGRHLSVQRYRK